MEMLEGSNQTLEILIQSIYPQRIQIELFTSRNYSGSINSLTVSVSVTVEWH
jgi:hypothetical protein